MTLFVFFSIWFCKTFDFVHEYSGAVYYNANELFYNTLNRIQTTENFGKMVIYTVLL